MSIGIGVTPPTEGSETATSLAAEGSRIRPWRKVFSDAATFLSPGALMGLLLGALIGGVGGRLAMLLLRLTSDDSVRGLKTDDDFTIGVISGETFFLLLITSFLGVFGGLVYMLGRGWLPAGWRAAVFGLLGATIGGALIIRPDGVDFTLVEPRLLAVALFVFLPGAYGVALSVCTERLMKTEGIGRSHWLWLGLLPFATVVFSGPPGIIALLIGALVIWVNRTGRMTSLWHSRPVTWLGRGAIVAVLVASSIFLAIDVVTVL